MSEVEMLGRGWLGCGITEATGTWPYQSGLPKDGCKALRGLADRLRKEACQPSQQVIIQYNALLIDCQIDQGQNEAIKIQLHQLGLKLIINLLFRVAEKVSQS